GRPPEVIRRRSPASHDLGRPPFRVRVSQRRRGVTTCLTCAATLRNPSLREGVKRLFWVFATSLRRKRLAMGGFKMPSHILAVRSSILTAAAFTSVVLLALPTAAQTQPGLALTGKIASQEEGLMEGVLVSAKRADSTITVTVVSNAEGQYSFPRDRLAPGKYSVAIRAVGYELPSRGTVEVTADQTADLDLNLVKTKYLARQLSNGEWLQSFTGTQQRKEALYRCVSCHTLERIANSSYNATEIAQVVQRMTFWAQGST